MGWSRDARPPAMNLAGPRQPALAERRLRARAVTHIIPWNPTASLGGSYWSLPIFYPKRGCCPERGGTGQGHMFSQLLVPYTEGLSLNTPLSSLSLPLAMDDLSDWRPWEGCPRGPAPPSLPGGCRSEASPAPTRSRVLHAGFSGNSGGALALCHPSVFLSTCSEPGRWGRGALFFFKDLWRSLHSTWEDPESPGQPPRSDPSSLPSRSVLAKDTLGSWTNVPGEKSALQLTLLLPSLPSTPPFGLALFSATRKTKSCTQLLGTKGNMCHGSSRGASSSPRHLPGHPQ